MKNFPMNEFIEPIKSKRYMTFNDGDYLFKVKQPVKGVYCLLSGKVKIVNNNSENSESFLYYANSPDILCLYSLLNEECYGTSAIASGEVKICFIPKKDFMKILFDNNKFTLSLMKIICSKINKIEHRINYNEHLN
jgi:CRP/FNR family transcriptional regulator